MPRLISIGPIVHVAPSEPEPQEYTRQPQADGLLFGDAGAVGRFLARMSADGVEFDDYPDGVWFNWPAAEGATDYRVYVGKTSGVYDYFVATGGALYVCLFLPENVTHYIIVRSWDGTAESDNSLEYTLLNGALLPVYGLFRSDNLRLGDEGVTA